MGFLETYSRELAAYARKYLSIEIESLCPHGLCGSKWDTGDTGTFNVWVHNQGGLDITHAFLHLNCTGDYGNIRYMPWQEAEEKATSWVSHLELAVPGVIEAGSSKGIYGDLLFQALTDTKGEQVNVFEAHLAEFEVSLNRMLNDDTARQYAAQAVGNVRILPR